MGTKSVPEVVKTRRRWKKPKGMLCLGVRTVLGKAFNATIILTK